MPKARVVAECFVKKLVSMGVDTTKLVTIGGDSTNLNTGWRGGAFTWIEEILHRRLNWIVCLIHIIGKDSLRKFIYFYLFKLRLTTFLFLKCHDFWLSLSYFISFNKGQVKIKI